MIKEIYIRTPEEKMYDDSIIDYSNEIESAISQIRMILGTENGEVLGEYNFGADISYLVFNTVKNSIQIKEKIKNQIDAYANFGKHITYDVDIEFGDSGEGYDYAVVDIILNGKKAAAFLIDKD